MSATDFNAALARLCASEVKAARSQPILMAEIMERLSNALALVIVIAADLNQKCIGELLEQASVCATEAAADHMRDLIKTVPKH